MLLFAVAVARVLFPRLPPGAVDRILCVQIMYVLIGVPTVIATSLWYIPLAVLNRASLVVLIAWPLPSPGAAAYVDTVTVVTRGK